MGDANDVNQMLLETSTAWVEGVQASERWLMGGRKRGNDSARATARKTQRTETHTRTEPKEDGTLVDDGDKKDEDSNNKNNNSDNSSAPEALVHRLMTYVFDRNLGGRHNASQGNGTNFEPPLRAVIFAETSSMRPAAAYQIHHTVYGKTSMTQSEKAIEAIVRHRKRLHVCSYDRDLVGGVLDGKPLHTRRHLLMLVGKGLRGERMDELPQMAHTETESRQDKKQETMVLFNDANRKTLSSFLQDSSSSSDDDDDD